MKKLCILVFMFLCALQINSMAQGGTAIDKQLEQLRTRQTYNMHKEHWNAAWIEVPDADRNAFGVFYFRKDIEISSLPETFLIHVSADQRYKLYVNGHLASLGPARNDSKHWNYETLDIAQYLTVVKNVVAAQVWSEGQFKPIANATIRSGFILLGEGEASVLNTDNSWKCRQDFSYTPIRQQVPGYYALGAGEKIDMNSHIGDWLDPDNQLTDWIQAKSYAVGAPHDDSSGTGTYLGHPLVPSSLPQVERYERRLKSVRRDGGLKLPKGWPEKQAVVYIPANKTIDILLDQQELTNGYFNLSFSKGKDAVIEITYAEAMFASRVTEANQRGPAKGNRNEIEGKEIIGRNDILISSGKPAQRFSSLDWRTFRYVNLHIALKDEPYMKHARRKMAELAGTEMPYEEFYQVIEERYEPYRVWALGEYKESGDEELWCKWLLPDYDQERIKQVCHELSFQYRQTKGRRVVVDGGVEVIKGLHERGYKLGIISNLIGENEVPDWLEEDGLDQYFDSVILSSVCHLRKPGFEIYQLCAKEMGVDLADCVSVADNVKRDIPGAKKAGVGCNIIFESPEKKHAVEFTEENRPDAVIKDFREILDLLPPLN